MRYVFADCLLDTQLYTLTRAGLVIPLRPKAFHVLRYLLEHRDHLVSKEELCAHVWPAQFISDATIEGCIKRARQAIGDTGRAQRLIQTRRGYGYRFVGAVVAQEDHARRAILAAWGLHQRLAAYRSGDPAEELFARPRPTWSGGPSVLRRSRPCRCQGSRSPCAPSGRWGGRPAPAGELAPRHCLPDAGRLSSGD